jgi:hypothetical protein
MGYLLLPLLLLACLTLMLAARAYLRCRVTGWYYAIGVAVAAYIPLLVFVALALVWIPGQYAGVCYRLGEIQQPCSFLAYLRSELFDLLVFSLIPLGVVAVFLGLLVFVDLLRYGARLTPGKDPGSSSSPG